MMSWFRSTGSVLTPNGSMIPNFTPEDTKEAIVRKTSRYLAHNGWKKLDPAPWVRLWVRAQKRKVILNLTIHQPQFFSWQTTIRDTSETCGGVFGLAGILSLSPIPSYVENMVEGSGLFAIHTSELGKVEEIILNTEQRNLSRRTMSEN